MNFQNRFGLAPPSPCIQSSSPPQSRGGRELRMQSGDLNASKCAGNQYDRCFRQARLVLALWQLASSKWFDQIRRSLLEASWPTTLLLQRSRASKSDSPEAITQRFATPFHQWDLHTPPRYTQSRLRQVGPVTNPITTYLSISYV